MISQSRVSTSGRFRRILHPTRFTAADASAFSIACALARDAQAELIVAHAADARDLYADSHYRRDIERSLEALRSSRPDVFISTVIVSGPVESEVVALCRDLKCELLVMRESAPGWIAGRWFDNRSQRMQKTAPCPTLCVSPAAGRSSRREDRPVRGAVPIATMNPLPKRPASRLPRRRLM